MRIFNFSASAKYMAMLSRFRCRYLNSIWYRSLVGGAGTRKNAQTVASLLLAKNWKRYISLTNFRFHISAWPRTKKSISEAKPVSGSLAMAGEPHAASFSGEVGCDNRCRIALDPIQKHTYLLLHQHFGHPGTPQELFELPHEEAWPAGAHVLGFGRGHPIRTNGLAGSVRDHRTGRPCRSLFN